MAMHDAVWWRLWYSDFFDREAGASFEAEGVGLMAGLEALWSKTLAEGIQDDGRPTFTWFDLEVEGVWQRIPRDPFANPEIARLREWREVEGLIPALARAHLSRLETGGAAWILAAVRESAEVEEFRRRLE